MDGLFDQIGKTETLPFKRELFRPIMVRYFDSPERLVHTLVEIKDAICKEPQMPLSRKALNTIMIRLQSSNLDEIMKNIMANPGLSEKDACIEIGLDLVEVFVQGMTDPSDRAINQAKEELRIDGSTIFADADVDKLAKEIQRKLMVEYLFSQFKSHLSKHAPPGAPLSLTDMLKNHERTEQPDIADTETTLELKIKFEDTTAFITRGDEETFLVRYAFTGVFISKKLSKQQLVDDLLTIANRRDRLITIVLDRESRVKGTPLVQWTELSRVVVGGSEKLFEKELLYHLVFL
jgi:hypothetical protein